MVFFLNYELDTSFELKCDDKVIQDLTTGQKKEYLTALLHVYEMQSTTKTSDSIFKDTVASLYSNEEALIDRFKYITSKKRNNKPVLALIFFIALFFLSYLFIFQSSAEPQYEPDKYTYFSDTNSYIIFSENQEYELYIDDVFITVLDEESGLELHKKGIELRTD